MQELNNTLKLLHIASQYLATAGIKYVKKKEDDSHTNLAWNIWKNRLESRPLNDNGIKLCLCFKKFELKIQDGESTIQNIVIEGKSHLEIVLWLKEIFKNLSFEKEYSYSLHYDLPYEAISDGFTYDDLDYNFILSYSSKLCIGKVGFEKFLKENDLESEIRVWQHHFDLGFYTQVKDDLYLGGGLAIPDALVDDHYFYASAYLNNVGLPPNLGNKLSKGKRIKSKWNGAVLRAFDLENEDVTAFYNEATAGFIQTKNN